MTRLNIKTISPVHIGTGDVYMSSEYYQDTISMNNKNYSVFKRINLIKYFNSLDKNSQDRFSKDLLNDKYKLPKLSDEFLRYYSYNRCDSRPNPGNQINENIKVLDKPYIPGSSIKGAIETALLYNSLTNEDIHEIFSGGGFDEKFANKFFSSNGLPQNSILRFLQISDSTTAPHPYIYDIKTIKANKKGGFSKVFNLYYETILGKNLVSTLTTNFDSRLFKKLNLEDKKYLLDLDYIKESIYNFSNDYMENELEFIEKYGKENSMVKEMYKFYRAYKKKNSIDSPFLKIGSTSGLLATTINLKIKHVDSYYFKRVKNSSRTKKAKYEYPVTRRISNKTGYPTGWIQLSFNEDDWNEI